MQAAAAAFRAVVEELADLDAGGDQLVPGGHDVGNDQECLGRTGSGRRDVLAEMDRAAGARRRELDQAEIFAGGAVDVEPPSDALVKLLRAVDIRNGDDDDLELHVNSRDARLAGWSLARTPCVGFGMFFLLCVQLSFLSACLTVVEFSAVSGEEWALQTGRP